MEAKDGLVGAVLVVGGGIGGIQAALDLAESGYYVYLLEKSPAIGGIMAQLDKTFPTNDCSMCILSPKLVECGRHLNIELITYAELKEVSGKAGNFRVKILKKPRYIDLTKCTGCAECENACPVEIKSEFDQGLSNRHAIYRPYPQAIPNAYTIEKAGISPCRNGCPAGVKVQGYVALTAQGKFKEALGVIRDTLPFPSICGRVCHHPCENECNRKDVDEPVSTRLLHKFIADWVRENGEEPPETIQPTREEKIAIIGAGPSGLTCALRLLEKGYPVTIFEASDKAGGMIASCIPDYRSPKEIANYEIDRLLAYGMELRTNVKVGRDIALNQLRKEYRAIYVAIGAQDPARLPVEGAEAKGVIYGLPFLRDAKSGRKIEDFGQRVIVIGGGNVAIDCAKSALRVGAKEVDLVCLETRDLTSKDRMPAHDWEIEEAEEEGVIIHGSLGPRKILSRDGRTIGLETQVCTSVYEDDGKFAPKFAEEAGPTIEADTVIIAIGQRPDLTGFEDVEQTPRRTIKADEITLETNLPGVFSGGDIVTGPASVIEAVAHGNEAAESINRFLNGVDLKEGRAKVAQVALLPERKIERKERAEIPKRSPQERVKDFNEMELGFSEQAAIEEASRCLNCAVCSECLQCVAACKANAIDHLMKETIEELNVGSVILSPGYQLFDPSVQYELGYRRFPNVVTSLEFERILSASGPFQGTLLRPSDSTPPQKMAFIQCVGSRDANNPYCSSVCCTYAIKEAIIAKEHSTIPLDVTIFFMDLRTYGKDFDRYYERAREESEVDFIRAKVCDIQGVDGTGDLAVKFATEEGGVRIEDFNLVVLSVGFQAPPEMASLARKLGIQLNPYGFCQTRSFSPIETSKPGIFVCGAFSGPKDIPETVMQASGAAGSASALLAPARKTLVKEKVYPPEKDVAGQEPRIGVFVCHCGINIGGVVNVPEVREYAATLPNVVFADANLYTCSQDTQEKIKQMIEEHNLNRVIVASCSPRTHEPLFQETIREAGLNRYLFEMTNIRDQCSWVHMHEPEKATEKAKDLMRMAVAKARLTEPLRQLSLDVNHAALVIGGGISGMVSALTLAEQGFKVHLVERNSELGGVARGIHYTLEGGDVQAYVADLIKKVKSHRLIEVYTNAYIVDASGYIGNFTTELMRYRGPFVEKIEHGVVIIATGGQEYKPNGEYLYGKDPRVLTSLELEEEIAKGNPQITNSNSLVMIQCVGSRNGERPYCSRVCCSQSLKNALKLKEMKPEMDIYILYRDMRSYGFKEDYYQEARRRGVIFLRYDLDHKPEVRTVKENGQYLLRVKVYDPVMGGEFVINADILALGVATTPSAEVRELAQLYKVPLNEDGFFMEAHVKLRPVDFATEGVFVCGLAHAPKSIEESISQAKAAASRATTILVKDSITAEGIVCSVNEDVCSGCGICEVLCPYNAIEVDRKEKVAKVNEALCKGCGTCCSACPSGAAQQRGFRRDQISSMIGAALGV